MKLDPVTTNPESYKVVFENDRLHANGTTRDVEIVAGTTGWLPAQMHAGENIGETDTHVIFVELKGDSESTGSNGPQI